MAKNYVQDGDVLTMTAPAGGVVAGVPVAIGQLVVVPLVTAGAGQPFAGRADGVWNIACAAGLAAGAKVSVKDGGLVADGTASSVPCGKLVTAEASGFANVRLQN